MVKHRLWIWLAACAILAGCASHARAPGGGAGATANAAQRREMLFGWWLDRTPMQGGGHRVKLALNCPDGVYFFDLRTLDAKGRLVAESDQVGDWGISGPVFFTIARGGRRDGKEYETDLTEGRHYQAYRILALTYTRFEYRSYVSGVVFAAHRASPDELSELRGVPGAMALPTSCRKDESGKAGG